MGREKTWGFVVKLTAGEKGELQVCREQIMCETCFQGGGVASIHFLSPSWGRVGWASREQLKAGIPSPELRLPHLNETDISAVTWMPRLLPVLRIPDWIVFKSHKPFPHNQNWIPKLKDLIHECLGDTIETWMLDRAWFLSWGLSAASMATTCQVLTVDSLCCAWPRALINSRSLDSLEQTPRALHFMVT